MVLIRRDWFGDALEVFELMHPQPTSEAVEEIARWRRLMRESSHTVEGDPERGSLPRQPAMPPNA